MKIIKDYIIDERSNFNVKDDLVFYSLLRCKLMIYEVSPGRYSADYWGKFY